MRTVRAASAAGAIVAIVVGAPLLLWWLALRVVPGRWPSTGEIVAVLIRPDDGRLLVGVLLVIGVLVWAQLTLSLLVELVSAMRGRPGVRVELPGLSVSRVVATALVTALLGTGTGAAEAAPAPPSTALVGTPAGVAAPASAEQPVYIVRPRDTLWRVAESVLGDPLRWRDLFALNVGRVQPDGGRLTQATLLRAGWTLLLPAAAPGGVVVRRGDTLSGIADEALHDVRRTGEVFALNKGHPQPDGTTLVDPDLIQPGWRITLPMAVGAPSAPAAPPDAPGTPSVPPPELPAPTRPPSAPPAVPTTSVPAAPAPGDADTSGPASPTPARATGEASDLAPAGQTSLPGYAAGAGGLAVTGLLAALAVRRRRQLRYRRSRHRITVPSDADGRLEWAAGQTSASLDRAALDAALRNLTAGETADDVPDLRGVELAPERALLTFATAVDLPPPFLREPGPGRWSLTSTTQTDAGAGCAPFPALASVASRDEASLLLDLEGLGVAHLTGDPAACRALLRHVAADLAHAPWNDDTEILLVGLDETLPALDPDRMRSVPDIRSALAEVTAHLHRIESLLYEHGTAAVVDARLAGIAPDAWSPLVVLASCDTAIGTELVELASHLAEHGRRSVAVLVHGADHVGHEIHISDDGELLTPTTGPGGWHAAGLGTELAAGFADLLTTTDEPDLPVPPAGSDEPWAAAMDDDGGLTNPPPAAPEARNAAPADPEALRRLEIVERQDPGLDNDLARWGSDAAPELPMIAILGDPAVRSPGPLPGSRRSWFTEVLVYLCLHPAGVDVHKALVDLWPDRADLDVSTIRHAFYGARRWAGRGLGGDPDKAFVSDMLVDNTYRLRGHLLDWDLFRRLRKRAQARRLARAPGALDDYRAALGLIRGPVFSALRPGGYAWLNNHDQRHDLQIPGFLVDTAHELVDLVLADGDTVTARWAAETARSIDVDTVFDRPLTDLMRVAAAEDQTSELERYAAILLDARGFDVPEELPPETFAVLNELLPAGPRRRPQP